MTQEEKQLLIVAICDYLPYKPILINKELSGGYPQKVFFQGNAELITETEYKESIRKIKEQ